MFIHNFKYTIKYLIKEKTSLFWAFIFPLALATFMFLSFRNVMSVSETFNTIEVALVSEGTAAAGIETMLDSLTKGDDALLHTTDYSAEDAKKALDDQKVDGIIYTKDASLVVAGSSINASILESILTQYKQNETMYKDIAATHPEKLPELMSSIGESGAYYVEKTSTDGNQNPFSNYFYAIFAMSCLFASFSSLETTSNLQANTSPLGMRKCVSASSKLVLILSDFSSLLLVHFIAEMLAFGYMKLLGLDFGNKYGAIILTLLLGCMIGLALGTIIGSISKLKKSSKVGIAIAFTMVLSVLADLCAAGVKDMIEHHAPIINRINPAALIADCFYALNVYDNYDRYFGNILMLAFESAVLIIISFFMLRRNKYASI